jgi:hypothetical protein
VNLLKGQATMLFITHQVPTGLMVDEVITLTPNASGAPRREAAT